MSPRRRISCATTRPCSARTIAVTWSAKAATSGNALEGTDLDLAAAGQRAPRGDLQGLVQVGRLDHPEAAELLLGLGVRAVGDDLGAGGVVDDGGAARRLEPAGEHPV